MFLILICVTYLRFFPFNFLKILQEGLENYAEKLSAENHELQEQLQKITQEHDDIVNQYNK